MSNASVRTSACLTHSDTPERRASESLGSNTLHGKVFILTEAQQLCEQKSVEGTDSNLVFKCQTASVLTLLSHLLQMTNNN